MMYLLNKKSILHCDENETTEHQNEINSIIAKLQKIKDYDCALVCKYQDVGHRNKEQMIKESSLHNITEMFDFFDLKNGADVYIGDDGYLVFYIYGQGYKYNERYYLVEMAVKVLPYNDDKQFIDISNCLLHGQKETVSREQFE